MRTVLRTLVLFAVLFTTQQATAQTTIFTDDFTSGSTTIIADGGTKVNDYKNPLKNCQVDKGLRTPGVGGNNPAKLILPAHNFDANNPFVSLSFNIYVLDANMSCNSAKPFPTATYVKVYLVKSSYNKTNKDPLPSEIYAVGDYQLNPANGNNVITFTDKQTAAIANGAAYRIFVDFKSPKNGVQGNTKYVIDEVVVAKDVCTEGGCAPFANNDYFEFGEGGFTGTTLKANVYGGFEPWESDPSVAGYKTKSLSFGFATNNGQDGDKRKSPLSAVQFELVSDLKILHSSCSATKPNAGTLKFNTNGTFEFKKGDACVGAVSFSYRIIDAKGYKSNIATVTIQLQQQVILPVTYKSFTAARSSHDKVLLEWETAMEENNRGFHVQRNVDGVWKNIGFVFSQAEGGNSSAVLKYAFKDANSSKGISQYRILQVDVDGKGKYSEVRSVRGETMAARITLFPNPSNTGAFNVMFEDGTSVRDVVVSDVSGRTIKQYKKISSNNLQVDGLADGFYTVQVMNHTSGTVTVEKAIIKKR